MVGWFSFNGEEIIDKLESWLNGLEIFGSKYFREIFLWMNQCRTIWDGDDGMKISPFKKCCCPSSLIVTSERQFIFIAILFKWYIEIWGGPWFRFFNWSESDTVFPNPTILQVYEDLSVSIFARWEGWKDHVYLGPGHVWGGSSKLRVCTPRRANCQLLLS